MNYRPEDAKKGSAWPEADYDGALEKVEAATSKTSGKPMEVWTFKFQNDQGFTKTVKMYVVEDEYAARKLRALARATGHEAEFKAGTFQANDVIDVGLRAHLDIESGGDNYDDKNRIAQFVPFKPVAAGTAAGIAATLRERSAAQRPTEPPYTETGPKDDDIPF